MRLRTVLAGACVLAVAAVTPSTYAVQGGPRRPSLPAVMLWAWERPTDLSPIDASRVGVAYLAGTVTLRRDAVLRQRRLQPLRVPPKTTILSVVRIEVDGQAPPTLSDAQRRAAADALVALAAHPRAAGLQIDFDATRSQRTFYTELIHEVRARLPEERLLSITALASWCIGDPWVERLRDVDEAVPMLFQMGPDRSAIEAALAAGRDFGPPSCRTGYGVSVDEPIEPLDRNRRVYVFSPAGWNPRTIADALAMTRQVRSAATGR